MDFDNLFKEYEYILPNGSPIRLPSKMRKEMEINTKQNTEPKWVPMYGLSRDELEEV